MIPTCGNCVHRDEQGDCIALSDAIVPMWTVFIKPVHAHQPAYECRAWEPKEGQEQTP